MMMVVDSYRHPERSRGTPDVLRNTGLRALCPNRSRKQHGFTIIELMIVVLIMSILVGVAVPSFR